ncbi:MAG: nitrite reductase, partial [Euryarchaeota archaeon]
MSEYEWRLREEVVEPGACAQCGTCAAVCPQGKIEMTEDGPELREECARKGEGNCHVVCPRTSTGAYHLGLRTAGSEYEPLLG